MSNKYNLYLNVFSQYIKNQDNIFHNIVLKICEGGLNFKCHKKLQRVYLFFEKRAI